MVKLRGCAWELYINRIQSHDVLNGILGKIKRELWIDYISVEHRDSCKGSVLLAAVENKLIQHLDSVQRKNIYVASVASAVGFYEVCGYREIITPEHELEDSDYPYVFRAEHLKWMCKGLVDEKIDNEEIYDFEPGIFLDSIENHSVKRLQSYLKFTIGIDFLWYMGLIFGRFYMRLDKFDVFIGNFRGYSGIKTVEEFDEKYYARYSSFLDDFTMYINDRTSRTIYDYFTKDEETVKKILDYSMEIIVDN